MKKSKWNYALFIPAILFALITIYPFLWNFCGSINAGPQIGRISFIPQEFTLVQYKTIFTKYDFPLYISNTLIYAIATTVLSLIINSLAAYALARLNFPGKQFFLMLILSTMMIPFSVIMIPLFLIMKLFGAINTLWALILPAMASGFGIFLLRQFYLGIPSDLEDAAKIDGLSYLGIYKNIVLPLSRPILLALALFAFLGAWNNYLWPVVVNTSPKLWLITTGIANFSSDRRTDWNMIMTGASVSMIPTMILFAFFQKQLVEGIKMTGLKQ